MNHTFIRQLKQDLNLASRKLGQREARYLVDVYYQMQDFRKHARNVERASGESDEPNAIVSWLGEEFYAMEKYIADAMGSYAAEFEVGRWSQGLKGIGNVLSAGLIAHIDITKCKSPAGIWRFAGLDPTVKWGKGEKRPWNAKLKVLCWKVGESFVKVSGRGSFYGEHYKQKKESLILQNEAGDFAEAAAEGAQRVGKTTEAYGYYSEGKLPPAQIHARAKRWTVKLFLSHWYDVAYEDMYSKEPPIPFAMAHLNHVGKIEVPRAG